MFDFHCHASYLRLVKTQREHNAKSIAAVNVILYHASPFYRYSTCQSRVICIHVLVNKVLKSMIKFRLHLNLDGEDVCLPLHFFRILLSIFTKYLDVILYSLTTISGVFFELLEHIYDAAQFCGRLNDTEIHACTVGLKITSSGWWEDHQFGWVLVLCVRKVFTT